MQPTSPADLTLADGREVHFDLDRMTYREYRSLFDNSQSEQEGDSIVARVAGLTYDDLVNLTYNEYRRVLRAFFRKAREPLADPP